jgi:hypothetical protein
VVADKFSKTAAAKIEAAGGTAQVLEYPGNETALELDTAELAPTEDAGSDSGPAKGE